jgi:hypothetical protein
MTKLTPLTKIKNVSYLYTFKTHGNGQKPQAETGEGVYVGGRQVEIGEEMRKHVSAHPSWTLSHCMFILCIGTIGSPQAVIVPGAG